jgi:hypothetical protein
MATTELMNLRSRVTNLAEIVTLGLSLPVVDLDAIYEDSARLLALVGEMRIVGAMLERQAVAGAVAVPCGRA